MSNKETYDSVLSHKILINPWTASPEASLIFLLNYNPRTSISNTYNLSKETMTDKFYNNKQKNT